jgi:hypothetical protein
MSIWMLRRCAHHCRGALQRCLCFCTAAYTRSLSTACVQKLKRHRAPPEFKEKVLAILCGAGYEEARSAKLAQEDFLTLLAAFNAAGIHFR